MKRIIQIAQNFRFTHRLVLGACFCLLAACGDTPPPTPQPEPEPTATAAETFEAVVEDLPTPPTATPFPTDTLTPTVTPEDTPAPTPTSIPPPLEGVFIDMPDGLAELNLVESVAGQFDGQLPADQLFPDHEQFLIDDWPVETTAGQPRILAFSAVYYASTNVLAQAEIDQLETLLQSTDVLESEESLPLLPVSLQPRPFVALAERLPFRSGSGLRYVTLLSLSTEDGDVAELFYVWQGLTSDGRGVISAVLPIKIDGLPEPPPLNGTEPEPFADWIESAQNTLAQLSDDAVKPPLSTLDALVTSIEANLPEPEMIIDASGNVDLTIVYPRDGGQTLIGRELRLEGFVQPGAEQEIDLQIASGTNVLAGKTIVSELDGWWQATLDVPENLKGIVQLTATAAGQSDAVLIALVGNQDNTNGGIEILRPSASDPLIAGYPFYLEGFITGELVDDTLTAGLYVDGCQTLVAKQSFTLLPEDQSWYGVLQIPYGASGTGCAVAWTGAYGQDNWREIQVPVTISPRPPEKSQIVIGNPVNLPLLPGSAATIFGTAFSSPSDTVVVTIRSEDGDLISEGAVSLETPGLWEHSFLIPKTAVGRLFVEARFDIENSVNQIVTLPLIAR